MALTVDEIKNTYPLPAFHYRVDIVGMDPAAFSEVSGLSMGCEVITYKDGLSCTQGDKRMPGLASDIKLTLKKGIVKADSKLYNWIGSTRLTTIEKRDLTISLMDEKGEIPVVTWKVTNAFPVKLDAPAFNAKTNDVAIESLDLVADHLTVQYT